MKRSVADFFGVGEDEDDQYNQHKWKCRSLQLHGSNIVMGGQVKQGQLEALSYDTLDGVLSESGTSTRLQHIHDPYRRCVHSQIALE